MTVSGLGSAPWPSEGPVRAHPWIRPPAIQGFNHDIGFLFSSEGVTRAATNPLGLDFGGNWLTGAALIAVLAHVYIFYGIESAGDIGALYLGLMLLNAVVPTGLDSPRAFFNLDWITLLVIFVIAVAGALYFFIARPDRGVGTHLHDAAEPTGAERS